MSQTYIAKDGDMIDYICWKYYGETFQNWTPDQQTIALNRVCAANRGITRALKLTAGTPVVLPDLPKPETTPIIQIWG